MDLHFPSTCSSPFTYLVSEHARAVVAIQELQREVNSLLSFREHVLEALPHLHLRGATSLHQEAAPRPTRPTSAPNSGKSLSEGTSTVVDSGFSTDKASTSMGKSSSSSSGELSGGNRWASGEPEASGGGNPPLGSAEDELWQLLEVIQRKGSKLRRDLERAEASEREYGHVSDPLFSHSQNNLYTTSRVLPPPPISPGRVSSQHNQHLQEEEETLSPPPAPVNIVDWWPHSLPGGAGPRFDFMPGGMEAWGELERLRQDRMYLMGRLSRAESEATTTHQRLLDLHSQLVSLAGEKRRLEDAFRTLKVDNQCNDTNQGLSSKVLVSGNGHNSVYRGSNRPHLGPFSVTSVRIGEDVILPRVLKVPIRDKNDVGSAIPRHQKPSRIPQVGTSSPTKVPSEGSTTQILLPVKEDSSNPSTLNPTCATPYSGSDSATASTSTRSSGGNRVVIERQRNANRVDGGLSMPASLLKGARINVRPNKQRISAILKEKDVLALQRHLLTTVMETEVLRRQIEVAGEEWSIRLTEWEAERQKGIEVENSLKQENSSLKEQLENFQRKPVSNATVGVWVTPTMRSVGVGTDSSDSDIAPSYSVHQGPNVKYDVVIYEESGSTSNDNGSFNKEDGTAKYSSPAPASIEKPPRRTRPLSGGASQHHVLSTSSSSLKAQPETSFGRDSLGRVAKVPLKPHRTPTTPNSIRTLSSTTPTSTPRSSPASSISGPTRFSMSRPSSAQGSSSATRYVARRDSMKVALGGPPSYINKGCVTPIAGTIKNGKISGSPTVNNAPKGGPIGGLHNSVGPPTPTHKSVLSNANGSIKRFARSSKLLTNTGKDASQNIRSGKISNIPGKAMPKNTQFTNERVSPRDSLESELYPRTHPPNARMYETPFPHYIRKGSQISPYIDGWGAPTPHYLNGSGANYAWASFMHGQYCLWSPRDPMSDSLENDQEEVLEADRTIGPIMQEEEISCNTLIDTEPSQKEQLTARLQKNYCYSSVLGSKGTTYNYTEASPTLYRDTEHQAVRSENKGTTSPIQYENKVSAKKDEHLSSSHKSLRRTSSGALKIKKSERPSVLPSQISKELSPLVLRGALDDVNYRVEQILSQIAAKNATY